jgi:acyl carrier protein|tara:strand:+ start:2524 stop:2745 length:222 start_codon:yes stop_codon:yes gene_type:complete
MNKLYEIVNEVLESNELDTQNTFKDTDNLKDDLGMDSFNLAELTVMIEDEFDIDIFEGDMVFTIGDIKTKLNG